MMPRLRLRRALAYRSGARVAPGRNPQMIYTVFVAVATLFFVAGINAVPASAAQDDTLCPSSDTTRVTIPSNFALPACFDGPSSSLIVRNTLGIPLEIRATPPAGLPILVPGPQATLTGAIVSLLAPATNGLTPPQYRLKIPIGTQKTTVSVALPPPSVMDSYWASYALSQAVGIIPPIGAAQGLVGFGGEVVQVLQDYRSCLARSTSNVGVVRCAADVVRNIKFAAARAGINALPTLKVQAIVQTVQAAWASHTAVNDATTLRRAGATQLTINAARTSPPPPPASASFSVAPAPPKPMGTVITLKSITPCPAGSTSVGLEFSGDQMAGSGVDASGAWTIRSQTFPVPGKSTTLQLQVTCKSNTATTMSYPVFDYATTPELSVNFSATRLSSTSYVVAVRPNANCPVPSDAAIVYMSRYNPSTYSDEWHGQATTVVSPNGSWQPIRATVPAGSAGNVFRVGVQCQRAGVVTFYYQSPPQIAG